MGEAFQPLKCVTFHVTFVETEGELIHVPSEVLYADVVVHPVNSPLEDRPDALYTVRGHVPVRIDTPTMVDGRTPVVALQGGVGGMFVGVDRGLGPYVLPNNLADRLPLNIGNRHSLDSAVLLPHSYHGSLADSATTFVELLVGVLVLLLAANESLIDFHNAFENRGVIPTSLSKSLEHEPSRLLGDTDFLRQLKARNALAGSHEQVHGVEPLMQRNMGPLEYRSCPDREVLFTGVTAVVSALAGRDIVRLPAMRANDLPWPTAGFEVDTGRFGIGVHTEKLEGADC